ncbi:MAG TPA: TonB family protein [Myxococcaceae bacterium]|nr:TonB family protein [Myxococcaceae bacterium]
MAMNDPLCGRVLNGRFSILEPIGSGGMGKVYKAIQAPLDRMVAIKVLHPQFSSNNRDPGFVKRFVLEASLTSKLRHPNTVTVIDYGQTEDGIFYIAMEYLEGQSLAEILSKQGALAWQRALHIGQQVCRSLREAHRFGIIHRDLKPANVMLLDEADHDLVKVLDFGLVKSFVGDGSTPDVEPDSKITQAGMLLGSPQYMSPEQARNHSDPRSDVYSFGVLVYEMIAGRPPFMAKDYLEVIVKHLKEPPAPFHTARPDLSIPMEVEDLVFRCLEKDPAHRFQSMDEILEALRGLGAAGVQNSFGGDSRSGVTSIPGIAAGPTPPPIPGGQLRDLTPRPQQQGGAYTPPPMPAGTPPPYGGRPSLGGVPTPISTPGMRRPPTQPGMRNPLAQSQSQQPFGVPAPFLPEEPETQRSGSGAVPNNGEGGTNVFAASMQPSSGANRMKLVAGGVGVALVLFLAFWLLTRPNKEPVQPGPAPGPGTSATATPQPGTTPAPTPPTTTPATAAAAKPVKFRVITEPAKAQIFYGAKMMGETPVEFEVNSDKPDGTVTIDLVLILDGYFPQPVTAGGSGVVIITQRMQKRTGTPQAGVFRPVSGVLPKKGGKRPTDDPYDGKFEAPELMVEAPLPPKEKEKEKAIDLAKPPEPAPVATTVTPPAPPPPAPIPAATPAPAGVVQFDSTTMNRPVVIEKGKPLAYTQEALHNRVEGTMIVKCIIATNGRVENCRFIKTLPYMEKAVLDALTSRTYKPLTQGGKAVSVDYVFEVKLKLPTEL